MTKNKETGWRLAIALYAAVIIVIVVGGVYAMTFREDTHEAAQREIPGGLEKNSPR